MNGCVSRNMLQCAARQLCCELQFSPPQLVGGSLSPPPSFKYPGRLCYRVTIRVGSREYEGYGPTPRSAGNVAAMVAWRGLQSRLREERIKKHEAQALSNDTGHQTDPKKKCPPPHPLLAVQTTPPRAVMATPPHHVSAVKTPPPHPLLLAATQHPHVPTTDSTTRLSHPLTLSALPTEGSLPTGAPASYHS